MGKATPYLSLRAALLGLALLLPGRAEAAWPSDPLVNLPVCTATHEQLAPNIISDGAGGAIFTWYDYRLSNVYPDIYAQRVSASGTPLWGPDGVPVASATDQQVTPLLAPDGAGGAIIAWQDFRSGTSWDIYAQRISAAGATQWLADGVPLCTVDQHQILSSIAADGAGGAIVAWYDRRNGYGQDDIYAQRIAADGTPLWAADGQVLCAATGDQQFPAILPIAGGGAIVAWQDARDYPFNWFIYAQEISGAGTVQWAADGVLISTAINTQTNPVIVSDNAGGGIITWMDYRSGLPNTFAQRISAAGAVQWAVNGVAICVASGYQYYPKATADGAGGAIITWYDYRFSNWDIYAQKVSAAGAIQWTPSGLIVCPFYNNQQSPDIVSDGAGGAIIAWMDERAAVGNSDIYAQRLSSSGAAQWTTYGIPLSTAATAQSFPLIASDGTGGAIVTWQDLRNGNTDVYAQRVQASGTLGGVVTGVPQEAPSAFALDPVRPNPSRGGVLSVRFTLTGSAAASLELLDVAGRRIGSREVASLGAGQHVIDLGQGRHFAPGLYLVRLREGASTRVTRAAVLE